VHFGEADIVSAAPDWICDLAGVVHRDHLLRSLVPLYLGCTAAYIQAANTATAEETEQALEATAVAFERQKPYLVEHWR
jgi:glucosylglycerate synthase